MTISSAKRAPRFVRLATALGLLAAIWLAGPERLLAQTRSGEAVNELDWDGAIGIWRIRTSDLLVRDLQLSKTGILVVGVAKGSNADKAGLKRGDLVLTKDGDRLSIMRGGRTFTAAVRSGDHDIDDAQLAELPRTSARGRTVVVDAAGRGNYRTITAALVTAATGDKIQIRSGVYRERMLVPGGVTVEAAPGAVVQVSAGVPIHVPGGQDVTIRGLNLLSRKGSALWINGNSNNVRVESCQMALAEGVEVARSPAVVEIFESKEVVVQDCQLTGNLQTKGVLMISSQARFVGNVISNNRWGMIARESCTVELSGNLLEGNLLGVAIEESTVNATENTVLFASSESQSADPEVGFFVDKGKALLTQNTVHGYRGAIDVCESRAEISHNTLSHNGRGIWGESGTFTISNNVIVNSKTEGIILKHSDPTGALAEATITGNSVSGNGGVGIAVAGFYGTVKYNLVEGNRTGVQVKDGNVHVRNNTVVYQRFDALRIIGAGRAYVYNNIVAFNGAGVGIADSARLVGMSHNNVFGNITSRQLPLVDGDYWRFDWLPTLSGEKYAINVRPADDLRPEDDFAEDPKFVRPGSDYRLSPDSPLANKQGKDAPYIGAFPMVGQAPADDAPEPSPPPADTCVLKLEAPAGATVTIDGHDYGTKREFTFQPLTPGKRYRSRLRVRFPDGRETEQNLAFEGGKVVRVTLP